MAAGTCSSTKITILNIAYTILTSELVVRNGLAWVAARADRLRAGSAVSSEFTGAEKAIRKICGVCLSGTFEVVIRAVR